MSGFLLKMIMVVFMLIDHIGYFIPNMPIEMRYVGRVVLPVFAFLMVEGYLYTSNKGKYLKRLVLAAQIMSIGSLIITLMAPMVIGYDGYIVDEVNLIISVGLTILTLYMLYKNKNKEEIDDTRALKSLAIIVIAGVSIMNGFSRDINPIVNNIFVALALSFIMLNGMNKLDKEGRTTTDITKIFIVLSLSAFSEGALITPAIVYVFYKFRENNFKKYIGFAIISILFLPGLELQRLLEFPQWMQIFAIIFMMLYNGKRGVDLKKFFYLFYPIHIWILFIIGLILK